MPRRQKRGSRRPRSSRLPPPRRSAAVLDPARKPAAPRASHGCPCRWRPAVADNAGAARDAFRRRHPPSSCGSRRSSVLPSGTGSNWSRKPAPPDRNPAGPSHRYPRLQAAGADCRWSGCGGSSRPRCRTKYATLPKSWPTSRSLGFLCPSHCSQWLTTSGSKSNSAQLRILPGLRSIQIRHVFRAATSARHCSSTLTILSLPSARRPRNPFCPSPCPSPRERGEGTQPQGLYVVLRRWKLSLSLHAGRGRGEGAFYRG
jgi:hypothetical protein